MPSRTEKRSALLNLLGLMLCIYLVKIYVYQFLIVHVLILFTTFCYGSFVMKNVMANITTFIAVELFKCSYTVKLLSFLCKRHILNSIPTADLEGAVASQLCFSSTVLRNTKDLMYCCRNTLFPVIYL